MDQNQTIDNDLQKAIDSITNETNIDPVFSDPVAAPSSVPEGDTGELGEPVGPFATPEMGPMPDAAKFEAPVDNVPEYIAPHDVGAEPMPPVIPAPFSSNDKMAETEFAPAPKPDLGVKPEAMPGVGAEDSSANLTMRQVKEAALRDLVPLVDKLNMTPTQKFNICRSIFEDLRDYTVLEQAYKAASEIPDATERAEALLYLVESIDKM